MVVNIILKSIEIKKEEILLSANWTISSKKFLPINILDLLVKLIHVSRNLVEGN
jgi:hypothetical protein